VPQANVQYFIIHRDGRREILWRYCRSWAEANKLCLRLKLTHNALRVWF
jgi:hypothetical protein